MSAEAVLGQLDDAAAKLAEFPIWLNEQIREVTQRVNSLLSAVPGWAEAIIGEIVEQARQLLQRISDLARQLIDWLVEEVWPGITGPHTLHTTGAEWTTTVFSQVSEVSGRVQLSQTRVDDFWGGSAATAYAQVIPAQRAAVDKVGEAVSTLRETIQSLAWSLVAVYVGIVAALLVGMVKIAGGTAAVASVLGIPPGLVAIVVGLAAAIGGSAAVYAVGKEMLSGTVSNLATLQELQHDSSAFDGGVWPQATSDLGDHQNWSPAQ